MKNLVDTLTYEKPITITAADVDEAMYLSTEYNYMITEALNEPHLLRLAAHLKKLADTGEGPGNFGRTFGQFHIQWDKVSSSNVKEYEFVTDTVVKAARKVLTGSGFVIATDDDWNFTKMFVNNGREKLFVDISGNKYTTSKYWQKMTATDTFDHVKNASHLIIINLNDVKDIDTYGIRANRVEAHTGMIPSSRDPHVGYEGKIMSDTRGQDYEKYCKNVAKNNYQRYKEIIAANKAKKDTDYEKINKMVKTCLDRMMDAISKVQGDPIKYADSLWSLGCIIDKVNGQKVYTGNYKYGNKGYTGENGVLALFGKYTRAYTNVVSKKGTYESESIKQYEKEIEDVISSIEYYFMQIGV